MAIKRVTSEAGFVLHHYDWSESSLILDVFTRQYGRVALVAKGAKKPSSNFRSVLLPLQRLSLAFTGDAEIRTLRSAEWVGGYPMPSGTSLMAGFYLNELLVRLIAREDPFPQLFDAYSSAVHLLATQRPEVMELALRAFELCLLKEVGVLPELSALTSNLAPVLPGHVYLLSPTGGLFEVSDRRSDGLPGEVCLALAAALNQGAGEASFAVLMQACAGGLQALKTQLRSLLLHHGGAQVFRTRALMNQMATV
jgi:DNA repair protein RecO (recombination protein O)